MPIPNIGSIKECLDHYGKIYLLDIKDHTLPLRADNEGRDQEDKQLYM